MKERRSYERNEETHFSFQIKSEGRRREEEKREKRGRKKRFFEFMSRAFKR